MLIKWCNRGDTCLRADKCRLSDDKEHIVGILQLRQAAEAGDASAMNSLGYSSPNGIGIEKNLTQAKVWYQKRRAWAMRMRSSIWDR